MSNTFLKKSSLLLLIACLALLININKPFYGHHDWNGVYFGNALRNTVKYGFLKLKFGFAYTFQPTSATKLNFYTHYPPVFHFCMGLAAKIMGVHEWSMRLVSVIASLVGLYLFLRLTKTLFNQKTAILAGVFYIFNPMFLYFGKMPIHEVIGLALINFVFLKYVRYFYHKSNKNFLKLIIALFLACQTVWVAYYLCPLLWLHHYIFKKQKPDNKSFILILLIPLMSFIGHLVHTYILTNSWDNGLFTTMLFRMQIGLKAFKFNFSWREYIYQELLWISVYFTKILCLLCFIYLLLFIKKLINKKMFLTDSFLVILLLFPLLDMLIFKNLYYIHDYKLFYFLLPIPMIAANCLLSIIQKLARLWKNNKNINLCIIILVFILVSTERINYVKILLTSSGNKIGYDLGRLINQNTNINDNVLIGSLSFGEYFAYFVNFYGERKNEYFEPNQQAFNKAINKKTKLVIIPKEREKIEPVLIELLLSEYQFKEDNQWIIFRRRE